MDAIKTRYSDVTLTTVQIISSEHCQLVATQYGEIKSVCVYVHPSYHNPTLTNLKPESSKPRAVLLQLLPSTHTELFHLLRYRVDDRAVMSLVPAAAPDHVITWSPVIEGSGGVVMYELKMEVCLSVRTYHCNCVYCMI